MYILRGDTPVLLFYFLDRIVLERYVYPFSSMVSLPFNIFSLSSTFTSPIILSGPSLYTTIGFEDVYIHMNL